MQTPPLLAVPMSLLKCSIPTVDLRSCIKEGSYGGYLLEPSAGDV